MARRSIHDVLADAQAQLDRLEPQQAHAEARRGAILIDTRSEDLRERDGSIPGALPLPLSVLEWRVDPASEHRDPRVGGGLDERLILICAHGYSSSLAAVRLRALGFERATDVVGGFDGWVRAGLPVAPAL
ncbi:MAG: rhodanese-like domain-containing protein [Actinomycetota bacterium]